MNDDLHALLHSAVDDVEPTRGFDEIRDRVGERPARSRRRWAPLVVAAAAAVALVTGGITWVAQQQLNDPPPRQAPAAGAPSASPSPRDVEVVAYYVGDTATGPRLFADRQIVSGVTGSDLEEAVRAAATRPPTDPDYVPFPMGDGLDVRVTRGADAVTVDLRGYRQPADAGAGKDQQMALQALIWTADAAVGAQLPVRFLLDGRPAQVVLSTLTNQPVTPLPADDALAAVSIESPAEGAQVGSTFQVRGQAMTNEANVVWQLKRGSTVVKRGFTTAEQCCTLSGYSFTVAGVPPGRYTLAVSDTNESDTEGFGITTDTKQLTVR